MSAGSSPSGYYYFYFWDPYNSGGDAKIRTVKIGETVSIDMQPSSSWRCQLSYRDATTGEVAYSASPILFTVTDGVPLLLDSYVYIFGGSPRAYFDTYAEYPDTPASMDRVFSVATTVMTFAALIGGPLFAVRFLWCLFQRLLGGGTWRDT